LSNAYIWLNRLELLTDSQALCTSDFEASELFSVLPKRCSDPAQVGEWQSISHGEWQVLGDYLQTGASRDGRALLARPESTQYCGAFVAALALRSGKNPQLDYEYSHISLEPQVPGTVVTLRRSSRRRQQIRRLRKPSSTTNGSRSLSGATCASVRSGSEGLKPSYERCGLLNGTIRIVARGLICVRAGRARDARRNGYIRTRPTGPPLVAGDSKLSITLKEKHEFR